MSNSIVLNGTQLECDGEELRPDGNCPKCERINQRIQAAIAATEAQKCVLCRHNNVGEDGQCNEPLPHQDRDGHYTCLCRCVFSAGAEEYADGPSGLEQGKSVDEVMANFAEYDLPETTDEEPTGCLDDNDELSREIVENWRRANDWPGLVWSAQNLSDEPRWLTAWTSLEQRIAAGLRTRPVEQEPVCWHCKVVLAPAPKPRCEDCPDECDIEGCDAEGCTEPEE